MKALVLEDKQKLAVQNIEKPTPNEREVLIRVSHCGVCGSDLARYFEGKVHAYPVVLGHEFSGTVEEVGSSVKSLKRGDRVTAAPLLPCGHCEYCQIGKPALCEQYSFLGSRTNGAMAEYIAAPEQNVLVLPENVSNKQAALVEPLSVAIHGVERVQVKPGDHVLVFGSGTIGLLTLLTLQALGAGETTVVDINEEKLKKARELGATHTINSQVTDLEDYYNQHEKPSVVIETAGVAATQLQSLRVIKKTGKVVFVGTAINDVNIPPNVFESILRGEIEITGSWMSYSEPFPGYEWRAALDFIRNDKVNLEPLISSVYSMKNEALPFERMRDPEDNCIKLMYELEAH